MDKSELVDKLETLRLKFYDCDLTEHNQKLDEIIQYVNCMNFSFVNLSELF